MEGYERTVMKFNNFAKKKDSRHPIKLTHTHLPERVDKECPYCALYGNVFDLKGIALQTNSDEELVELSMRVHECKDEKAKKRIRRGQ